MLWGRGWVIETSMRKCLILLVTCICLSATSCYRSAHFCVSVILRVSLCEPSNSRATGRHPIFCVAQSRAKHRVQGKQVGCH
ncbi:hypothetical protein V1522DRAFT_414374 [Lipomyces starkeyi]